jgi:hypothetical protein
MKRRATTWTAGGVSLIWQQPISDRDFRSALILTGYRDVRLRSVDAGMLISMLVTAQLWSAPTNPGKSYILTFWENALLVFRYRKVLQNAFSVHFPGRQIIDERSSKPFWSWCNENKNFVFAFDFARTRHRKLPGLLGNSDGCATVSIFTGSIV